MCHLRSQPLDQLRSKGGPGCLPAEHMLEVRWEDEEARTGIGGGKSLARPGAPGFEWEGSELEKRQRQISSTMGKAEEFDCFSSCFFLKQWEQLKRL